MSDNLNLQHNYLEKIKEEELTVKETNSLISQIMSDQEEKGEIKTVYQDLRVFRNTLNQTITEMKDAGLEVEVKKQKDDDYYRYTIILPRNEKK